ncbi:hypothetical protein R6Q57_013197 [Mikania cordata]
MNMKLLLLMFHHTPHIDAAKPLYSFQIMTSYIGNAQYNHANFLIDIDAPFIWHDCIVQWNIYPGSCPNNALCMSPVSCEEYQCIDNPSCAPETNGSTLPGLGFCTCPVNVVNPVTGSCTQALLNYDEFTMYTSDGRHAGVEAFNIYYGAYPNAACVRSSSFASFPTKPSAPGLLFFGTGPYYLLPQSNVDVRSYLTYTPLLKLQDSFGYFISVVSIVIKKRSINVPANTTTKLSTIDPYTTLRTDIYNGVVSRFSKVTKRIPSANPIAPFGLCYNTLTTGLKVPDIDFILPDGKKWSVSTANSIKQVTNEVACLAFVDGGATSEPAIVIGTFQFEDNFLEFDLENSTFGFSSSLLRKQTSCANFNFTLTSGP